MPDSSFRPLLTGASYLGNRFLSHAEKDLDVLAESCDYVVHTVSETDLNFHKSALAKIFDATRRRGLEIWADPWGVGGVFGGESFSKFLLDHPEVWQMLSDGRRVPAACLNSPVFLHFAQEWILNVRDMGAEVLFWDEPHPYFRFGLEWEGVFSCVCPGCQALFQEKTGGPFPERLNDAARLFRRETIRRFLGEITDFAKARGLRNALCLYAYEGNGDFEKIWNDSAAIPSLDVFGCDPYWRWPPRQREPFAHVASFAKKVVDAARAHGKDSQIWIQSMRFNRGQEAEIREACRAAAEAGASHLAAWSYDGGALLDTVLSEDPSRVWAEVSAAFKGLKTKPA